MSEDASFTYIADPDAASHALASMAARANVLGERLGAIASTIEGLEVAKPWGTAEEYGGQFEKQYHAGGNGAQFVRDNVKILAAETADGASTAHKALRGSIELDSEGAALFRTQESGDVAARMQQIGNDRATALPSE